MIDWHSHILPKMDDGSKTVDESITLLTTLKSQGVDTVIATPHFYANDETVADFIKRRTKSIDALSPQLNDDLPKILLGAEVSYYSGISRLEDLQKLKIEGTDLLLLEMPFSRWTEYTLRELSELSACGKYVIILAHIERYMAFQDKDVWSRLCDCGILMQSNASFFNSFTQKKKALKLLKERKIHLIGSDCHNMTSRPPKLQKAYDYISKKLGLKFLSDINEFGSTLLG